MTVLPHVGYALAWGSFGLAHSLLATPGAKARLRPWLGAGYRLAYNGFAVLHLMLIGLAGQWLLGGRPLPLRPAGLVMVQDGLALAGVLVFLAALADYDLGRLAGTAHLKARARGIDLADDEPLHLAGLHRYVRHPLYAGAYLMLWGGVADERGLALALWASLYLFVGTVLEERKLLRLHGDSYRRYRARVPMLIPWRARLP